MFSTYRFELLHKDIWGPFCVNFIHKHIYVLTIVDDFRCFMWIVLLKNKGEVQFQAECSVNLEEKQLNAGGC